MSVRQHTVSCASNVLPLREALVKHPRDAWGRVRDDWDTLGFTGEPDPNAAAREFEAFCDGLRSLGVRLHYLPFDARTDSDSLYTHDPVISTGEGLVLCRTGKENRRAESAAVEAWATDHDVPVAGRIEAPGLLEGGDLIWLDRHTVAVGLGFRSNAEGARQFGALAGVDVVEVPLPWHQGPGDVLHLMSLISPLDQELALVHRRLLPVPFLQLLEGRGWDLLVLPEHEYETLGCNVLAVAPRVALAVRGNPETRRLLEGAGCEVHTYAGAQISMMGLGGPTCLTRPLLRSGTDPRDGGT